MRSRVTTSRNHNRWNPPSPPLPKSSGEVHPHLPCAFWSPKTLGPRLPPEDKRKSTAGHPSNYHLHIYCHVKENPGSNSVVVETKTAGAVACKPGFLVTDRLLTAGSHPAVPKYPRQSPHARHSPEGTRRSRGIDAPFGEGLEPTPQHRPDESHPLVSADTTRELSSRA